MKEVATVLLSMCTMGYLRVVARTIAGGCDDYLMNGIVYGCLDYSKWLITIDTEYDYEYYGSLL